MDSDKNKLTINDFISWILYILLITSGLIVILRFWDLVNLKLAQKMLGSIIVTMVLLISSKIFFKK